MNHPRIEISRGEGRTLKTKIFRWYIPLLSFLLSCLSLTALWINQVTTVLSEGKIVSNRCRIIIDAGHGGVDGGATSCTGVLESGINLQIALKLDALFHLLGYHTIMIRTEDISVYTEGSSIAQKKISDLKERLRIINFQENALFISIHQNYFQDSQYRGAQVFYAKTQGSEALAKSLQMGFRSCDEYNHRSHKPSKGVYLMDHIKCVGVLVECGFISNPYEDALLQNADYQKMLCGIIATTTALFLDQAMTN